MNANVKTPEVSGGSGASDRSEDRRGGATNNKKGNDGRGIIPRQTKFEGRCDGLKGHIFDYKGSGMADQFIKTKKEVSIYVGTEYKQGSDLRLGIDNLTAPTITLPANPPVNADATLTRIWEKQVDLYVKKVDQLETNNQALFSLVWGQCTDAMQAKVEAAPTYEQVASTNNGIELLKLIKDISFNFASQKYLPQAIHEAKRRFFLQFQGRQLNVKDYLEQFTNHMNVLDHIGANVVNDTGILEQVAQGAVITDAHKNEAKELYYATAFIMGADRSRFGKLLEDLENSHLLGDDVYPKTVNDAYNLLCHWKQDVRSNPRTSDGVMFNNNGTLIENGNTMVNQGGAKTKNKDNITCYTCGQKGHYSTTCPNKDETKVTGHNMLNSGNIEGDEFHHNHMFFQNNEDKPNGKIIPPSWILLDNQSTIDVFSNKNLLSNIQQVEQTMVIHCNAGSAETNLMGELGNYGKVWYHPSGIANILSLARVKEKFKVTFDSTMGNAFTLWKEDGKNKIFKQSATGLYYLDTQEGEQNENQENNNRTISGTKKGINFFNTVAENKINYTNNEYSRASLARKLQNTMGRPSTADFKKLVSKNLLPNCPITVEDINAAEHIFGTDIGTLKGKTPRLSPDKIRPINITVPPAIYEQYKNVTVCMDIMFINRIPFLVSKSRRILFSTAEMISNRSVNTLSKAIKNIHSLYNTRGFKIETCIMDGEFEPLRGYLAELNIYLQTTARDEHVGDIERHIRTIKERCRAVYNTLPFTYIPIRMIAELVYSANFWLNSFPHNNGISKVLSPRTLITGSTIDYKKHCMLEFGTYVQTHEQHDNSMLPRTIGAIALRPTGNAQGGHFFMSLSTGRVINRYKWTELPMPHDVIDRVHQIAAQQHRHPGLVFHDGAGALIQENDDVGEHINNEEPMEQDNEIYNEEPEEDANPINHIDNGPDDNAEVEILQADNAEVDLGNNIAQEIIEIVDDPFEAYIENIEEENNPPELMDPDPGPIPDDALPNIDINNEEGEDPEQAAINEHMDAQYGPREHQYNLRPRRARDYGFLHNTINNSGSVGATVLTQYSLNKGLKVFGEAGTNAVIKELKQLHIRKAIKPVYKHHLSSEQRYRSLQYLMFLKEKRTGEIKARGCADGRKQRGYVLKEDSSAPTVSNEALLLSCVIDAKEERDVAFVDLPGAFLHANMTEEVHVKFEGTMAKLIAQLDPALYSTYIHEENGKPVLYVLLLKALYGTLQAALLFWNRLKNQLEQWGFILNPYDICVANKTINGHQCTVLWHVDDIKISHVDTDVVTDIINKIQAEFGQEAPITVTRGKKHEYLGMELDFSVKGKVIITMINYIDDMLDELPDDMNGIAVTPAASHLFSVSDTANKLEKGQSEFFHHHVAKLLFLCKRARPDIQTAVAFLCTRVKSPDTDDYKKLARVMKYLRGTSTLPLTLEADASGILNWWVDAAYAVHPDMKGHTGGALSMGKGVIYGTSTRQKLVTRSSTEAELVGIHDVLPQIIWTRNFLESQGYAVTDSILHQDNKSTILLAENGRASSSRRTRHINIRYFFVQDKLDNKELSIQHCPTDEMLSDYFSKPVQGTLFRKFRNNIMNYYDSDATDAVPSNHKSVLGV